MPKPWLSAFALIDRSSYRASFEFAPPKGIGVDKLNNWAFDTTQFDSIFKRLKVQAVQSNDTGIKKKSTKVESETSVVCDHLDTVLKATRRQGRKVVVYIILKSYSDKMDRVYG
ncbi:G patch domain-containing protein 4-like isoform X1 [Senna tora]|uniref:G patch domain-containing protein 4-like isoform X1 n=1 Tax=Senna tora TaxID=362788 RepID=A0A834XKC9_9FABA|nr:G patch domain-containing protein 4-like isoform X1 [Senna tora]